MVIATGCRGTTALATSAKRFKDVGDQILAWDGEHLDLEHLWMPYDKAPTNDQVARANNFVNNVFTQVKRKVSSESAAVLKCCVLRSAMIARCLRAGMDELTVSTLASTGVEQIRAR